MTLNVGDVVDDRFVIERVAATGGMGTVFRAYDRLTGDLVALKVNNTCEPWRFALETRITHSVEHPFIVKYVAHGQKDGVPYLALEWLDGEDLGARLRRGSLSLTESLSVVRRVARALCPLHDAGIVHRDVKPGNVFLMDCRADRAHLLDFGVARVMNRGFDDDDRTNTGVIVGTPLYMAPEQARCEPIDQRTDVYALGTLLYECLAGASPFGTGNLAVLMLRLLREPVPRLSERVDVPEEVEILCTSMLDKDPGRRPRDARAVCDAIEHLAPRRASIGPRVRLFVGDGADCNATTDSFAT